MTAASSAMSGIITLPKARNRELRSSAHSRFRGSLPVRPRRRQPVDRREPQCRGGLRARFWKAGASRQGPAPSDQLPAHRHGGRELLRRSRISQHAAGMILVTGGAGFIGSHLLERLSATGVPARCLLRPTKQPRKLPPGWSPCLAISPPAREWTRHSAARRPSSTLAGVTKALTVDEFYSRQRARLKSCYGRCKAVTSTSCTSVRSLPSAPAAMARRSPKRGIPVRSPMESPSWRRSDWFGVAPQAVILRPPVVYGPRDTDVFQLLGNPSPRGLVLGVSGGDQWFSAIYQRMTSWTA